MMQDTENIADVAALWVARMENSGWSSADERALQDWLNGDMRRRGALLQAQAAWVSLDIGTYGQPAFPAASPHLHRRLFLGGGAVLAASIAGGIAWLPSGNTYRTEVGEIRTVPLADGSTASINSGSVLKVTLADNRRDIRLGSGEAWFRVAKDARRPFVVKAGAVVVQAVGTAFSVRRRSNGADILVTEGVVETWAAAADGHRKRLTAGQRAYVGDNSLIQVHGDAPSAVDRALAWRSGLIDLTGLSISAAVDEFNRYNRRKLVLAADGLADKQFDGVFRTDNPEGFAAAVGASFGVPVRLEDPGEIRIGVDHRI